MKEVTDPVLLAKLNGTSSPGTEVTDPTLLAKLNGKTSNDISLSNKEKSALGSQPYYSSDMNGAGPINWEELKKLGTNIKDIGKGTAESLVNYPGKIVNLVKKNTVPELKFAPDNAAGNLGKGVGDAASFFLPGKAIESASAITKIANPLINLAEKIPFAKSTYGIGKNALNAGTLAATQQPENKKNAFEKGGEQGAITQTAINAITSKLPILRGIGHAAAGYLGYLAGSTVGHPDVGIALGTFAPTALKSAGVVGKNAVSESALSGLNPSDVESSVLSNRRLGTSITPAQASGNYPKAGEEGNYKRSIEGGQEGYRLERQQESEQRKAINNTLDKIYKPTPTNETAINAAYKKAERVNLNPKAIDHMRSNPIMDEAFKSVGNLPAFKNVPQNNYAYLAQVDRALYRMQKGKVVNDPNSAYAIGKIKEQYSKFLKDTNPDYAEATRLAQPKIVRRNMEEKLNKNDEDYTGKNFYSKFLNNRASTATVLRDVRKIPEARQAIQDMRVGWKNLSNIKTVSQSNAQAQSGISQARGKFKELLEHIKNFAGAKDDIKALQYIHSHDARWFDDFERLARIKNEPERNRKWLTLLGGIAEGAGLTHRDDEA